MPSIYRYVRKCKCDDVVLVPQHMHVHMYKLVCTDVWLCGSTKVMNVGCLGTDGG